MIKTAISFLGRSGVGKFHLPEVKKLILAWMEPVRPMTFISLVHRQYFLRKWAIKTGLLQQSWLFSSAASVFINFIWGKLAGELFI